MKAIVLMGVICLECPSVQGRMHLGRSPTLRYVTLRVRSLCTKWRIPANRNLTRTHSPNPNPDLISVFTPPER